MQTDWQLEKKTLKDRYEHLWKTGEKSDCRFHAGGNIFPAHKLILFAASPVFERMFYGEMPVKDNELINIEDIESDDFKDLLYYIYCNSYEIKTMEKAINLYYAAKKYMLNDLTNECLAYLKKAVNTENAFQIYEFAKFYEEQDLLQIVMQVIRNNACQAMTNATNRVDISIVITIFDEQKLGSSEVELFNALKNLAIIENVIPGSEENSTKRVDDSELELFQKLEELTKVQGIFEEEMSAKALEVLNENENIQVKHLQDFRNIQNCFTITKKHLIKTLDEIAKIKGNQTVEATSAKAKTKESTSVKDKTKEVECVAAAAVAATEPPNILENVPEGAKLLLKKDDNNVASNILNDIEPLDDAIYKRFKLYQKFRTAVKKIEFLGFSQEQFYKYVAFSGLLLPEESLAILGCIAFRNKTKNLYPKDFKKNFRIPMHC